MMRAYNLRPLPRSDVKFRRLQPRTIRKIVIGVLAVYVVYAVIRPVPPPQVVLTPPVIPALVRVNTPWPSSGPAEQAAFGGQGYGLLAHKGTENPVPIASVTKAVTALLVLQKKPLKSGEQGPDITITARDVDLYYQYAEKEGVVIPVFEGQTITEYQALQAVMLPSANNISDTLAIWAFGSMEAYTSQATKYLRAHGMSQTTITDASGFAPSTVSTASDLVRLGDMVLDNRVLTEIIAQRTAVFPDYGPIENTNAFLGQSGIRGIKTGHTEQSGGCFLGVADVLINGKKLTLITAVLGASDLDQAMRDTRPLIDSAPAQFQTVHVVRTGQVLGQAKVAGRKPVDIRASTPVDVISWTGTAITPRVEPEKLKAPAPANTPAGTLILDFNGSKLSSQLRTTERIPRPALWWRLTHPF